MDTKKSITIITILIIVILLVSIFLTGEEKPEKVTLNENSDFLLDDSGNYLEINSSYNYINPNSSQSEGGDDKNYIIHTNNKESTENYSQLIDVPNPNNYIPYQNTVEYSPEEIKNIETIKNEGGSSECSEIAILVDTLGVSKEQAQMIMELNPQLQNMCSVEYSGLSVSVIISE